MKPRGSEARGTASAMTRHEAFASGILGKYAPARRSSERGLSLIFRKAGRTKPSKAASKAVRAHAPTADSRERHRETQRIVEKLRVLEREKIVEREKVVIRQVFVVREAERIIREQRLLRERAVISPPPAADRQPTAPAGSGVVTNPVPEKRVARAASPERAREAKSGTSPARAQEAKSAASPERTQGGNRAASQERVTGSERERPANVNAADRTRAAAAPFYADYGARPEVPEGTSLASGAQESFGGVHRTGREWPSVGTQEERSAEAVRASFRDKDAEADRQPLSLKGAGSGRALGIGRIKAALADAVQRRSHWPATARRKGPDTRSSVGAEAMQPISLLRAKGRPVLKRAVFEGPLIVFRRGSGRAAMTETPSYAASERSRSFRAETEATAGRDRALPKSGVAAPSPSLAKQPESVRNALTGPWTPASLQEEERVRSDSSFASPASHGRLESRLPSADTRDALSAETDARLSEYKRQDVAGTTDFASNAEEAERTPKDNASPPRGLKENLQAGESASSSVRALKPVEIRFRREGNADAVSEGDEGDLEDEADRTYGQFASLDADGADGGLPEGVPVSSVSSPETFPVDRTSPAHVRPEKGKFVRVTGPRPEGGLPSVYWLVSAERLAAVPNRVVTIPSPLRLVDRLSRRSGSIRLNVPEPRGSAGTALFGTPAPVDGGAFPAMAADGSPKSTSRDPFDSRDAGRGVRPEQVANANESTAVRSAVRLPGSRPLASEPAGASSSNAAPVSKNDTGDSATGRARASAAGAFTNFEAQRQGLSGRDPIQGERKRWPGLTFVKRLNGQVPITLRRPGHPSALPPSDATRMNTGPAAKLPTGGLEGARQTRDPKPRWGHPAAQFQLLAFRRPNAGSRSETGAASSLRSSTGAHSGATVDPHRHDNAAGASNVTGTGFLANGASGNTAQATAAINNAAKAIKDLDHAAPATGHPVLSPTPPAHLARDGRTTAPQTGEFASGVIEPNSHGSLGAAASHAMAGSASLKRREDTEKPDAGAGEPDALEAAGRTARGFYAAKTGVGNGRYPALAPLYAGGALLSRRRGSSLAADAEGPAARANDALPVSRQLVRPGSAGRAGTLQMSASKALLASNRRAAPMDGLTRSGLARLGSTRSGSIRTAVFSGAGTPSTAAKLTTIGARSSAESGRPSTGRPTASSGLTLAWRQRATASMASPSVAAELARADSSAKPRRTAAGVHPPRPLTARSLTGSPAFAERGSHAAPLRLPVADGAIADGTAFAPPSPALTPAALRQGAPRPEAPRLALHAPPRAPTERSSAAAPAPADLEMRRQERPASVPERPREAAAPEPRPVDEEQLKEALSRMPELQPDKLADQVYKALMKKMKFEQRLRGY